MPNRSTGQWFVNNIELVLSTVGLAVIVTVPLLLQPSPDELWRVAAVTAVVVGLLHGVIFWLIRRRQRQMRAATIAQIREMLQDVVRNQLAVISMNAQLSGAQSRHQQRIEASINRIEEALRHISEESLTRWLAHYEHITGVEQVPAAHQDKAGL
jgi:ABC-type multidrug transport system fused ATPase/permease subunit